jgi:AraC-like DNA-binding protein
MSLSVVRSFTELDEFAAAAMPGATVEPCLLAPGEFYAKITSISLHALKIRAFSVSRQHIMHASLRDDSALFSFLLPTGADLFYNGTRLTSVGVARLVRRDSFFQRTAEPAIWGCMFLPPEVIRTAGATVAGLDLVAPKAEIIVACAPRPIAKLRRLTESARLLAEGTPEVIAQPEAARSLEQSLIESLADCFSRGDCSEDRSTQRRHHRIMRQFHAILQNDPERPIYILELAQMIGVSLRSLSACCQEYLGMGPKRYLRLRRMHLARQALRKAAPNAITVTDVATQFGFWQLGRFAGEYKSLFGETPSCTLKRRCP